MASTYAKESSLEQGDGTRPRVWYIQRGCKLWSKKWQSWDSRSPSKFRTKEAAEKEIERLLEWEHRSKLEAQPTHKATTHR